MGLRLDPELCAALAELDSATGDLTAPQFRPLLDGFAFSHANGNHRLIVGTARMGRCGEFSQANSYTVSAGRDTVLRRNGRAS